MCDWQFGRIYLMLAWILGFSDVIFKFIFTSYFQKNQPFIGYVKKRGLVKKKKDQNPWHHQTPHIPTSVLPLSSSDGAAVEGPGLPTGNIPTVGMGPSDHILQVRLPMLRLAMAFANKPDPRGLLTLIPHACILNEYFF